jgi:hypothetical protein
MATATIDIKNSLDLDFVLRNLMDRYTAHMEQAEKLESKGATIKNRIYEARAMEVACLIKSLAPDAAIAAKADEMRKQAEARAYNHKAVKEERAIRRAEFKAANPTATEQE